MGEDRSGAGGPVPGRGRHLLGVLEKVEGSPLFKGKEKEKEEEKVEEEPEGTRGPGPGRVPLPGLVQKATETVEVRRGEPRGPEGSVH